EERAAVVGAAKPSRAIECSRRIAKERAVGIAAVRPKGGEGIESLFGSGGRGGHGRGGDEDECGAGHQKPPRESQDGHVNSCLFRSEPGLAPSIEPRCIRRPLTPASVAIAYVQAADCLCLKE